MKLFSWLVLGLLVTAGATLAAMQSAPVFFTSDSLHGVAATGPAKGSWNAVMVAIRTHPAPQSFASRCPTATQTSRITIRTPNISP